MSIRSEIAGALQEAESAIPNTITISGTDYACSSSSFSRKKLLEVGGFGGEYKFSVTIRRSLFSGSLPAENAPAVYDGVSIKVDEVVTDPTGAIVRVFLIHPSNGL